MTENRRMPRLVRRRLDDLAVAAHMVHGTRGLVIGGAGLLVIGLLQPALPSDWSRLWLVAPVFSILIVGLATLPREGVALQHRARALMRRDDAAKRLARTLVWPLLLLVLLIPRVFLAGVGIPHMSPLTGLALPSIQQRITHVVLFTIILLAAAYIRSTRGYAKHVLAKRPKDLSRGDHSHQERDALLWMAGGILVAYAFLLRGFWQPFSLLQWPPDLDSLRVGVRGVTSITFSIAIPLMAFTTISGHASLLRDLLKREDRGENADVIWLAIAHVAAGLGCVALHIYDLLWIAQYRASAPF